MLHVIVNSGAVASILEKLLHEERLAELVEIRASYPLSSLYGSAKTFLGVKNEPVAILLDANSTEPEVATRLRESAEEVLADAVGGAPLKILIAVPAVESLFFGRPDAVRRAFPQASDSVIEIGRISPATALSRLDSSGESSVAALRLLKELNAEDIAAIRMSSPIKGLLDFLGELQRDGVVCAVATV